MFPSTCMKTLTVYPRVSQVQKESDFQSVEQVGSLTSDRTKKGFFKPKLFDVCANFTKVRLEIRARVISRGPIIFMRRSEVSNPRRSGATFLPA